MSDKSGNAGPVARWRDRAPGSKAAEDRSAALIRDALDLGDPGEAWMGRVRERISRRRRRPGFSPRLLRLALAAVVLLAGASVAAYQAARHAGWLASPKPDAATRASKRPAAPARPPSAKREVGAPADQGQPPATEPEPASEMVRPQAPARAIARSASPRARPERAAAPEPWQPPDERSPSPTQAWAAPKDQGHLARIEPEPASEIRPQEPPRLITRSASPRPGPESGAAAEAWQPPEEIRALDQAVGLLRKERNPGAALAALDRYLSRYPAGALAREARVARVDALLLLGRSPDALAALEALPLDPYGRSIELQVIRGELRAGSNCVRAEEDFSAVLSRAPDGPLAERALYGRAVCRGKRGDHAAASADIRAYLARFPTGVHAAWARRWLEGGGQ
jgi:TolA-binding protein